MVTLTGSVASALQVHSIEVILVYDRFRQRSDSNS